VVHLTSFKLIIDEYYLIKVIHSKNKNYKTANGCFFWKLSFFFETSFLGVSDFLSAVAWNREKDVEMILAKDWPIHGPWIVFVGR